MAAFFPLVGHDFVSFARTPAQTNPNRVVIVLILPLPHLCMTYQYSHPSPLIVVFGRSPRNSECVMPAAWIMYMRLDVGAVLAVSTLTLSEDFTSRVLQTW